MDCERSAWLWTWILIGLNPYCVSRMVRVTWVFLCFQHFILFAYRLNGKKINYCSAHFSENYGYIVISPIPSLNLLSFLFGRTLDAHAGRTAEDLFQTTFHAYHEPPRCLQGRHCYVDAIYLTIGISLFSFFLSLWAGYRDSREADKLLVGEENDWICFSLFLLFFLGFLFEVATGNTFIGGFHSMNPLRIFLRVD